MFCQNCGMQIPNGGVCPRCYLAANNMSVKKERKSFAALATAFLVFPATFSVAIDLCVHKYDFWFGYVLGAILIFWFCAVLPVLDILPAPVNVVIAITSVVGYVLFILYKAGKLEEDWVYEVLIPLLALFAVFFILDEVLLKVAKIGVPGMFAAITFETGIFFITIEALAKDGFENLRWSPILACGLISVASVCAAIGYVAKINKKK